MTSQDDLRIGDRERDEATRILHDAFAYGRLTRDELDERLDLALSARTHGELRRVVADLPGDGRVADVDPMSGSRRTTVGRRWSAHGGHRPLALIALAVLVIAALLSGTAWPLLAAARVALFVWLAMTLVGLARRRHGRSRRDRHRYWHLHPPSHGHPYANLYRHLYGHLYGGHHQHRQRHGTADHNAL